MNPETVEKITKLVMEKLQGSTNETSKQQESSLENKSFFKVAAATDNHGFSEPQGKVVFVKHNESKSAEQHSNTTIELKRSPEKQKQPQIENVKNREELEQLMSKTPARIGVGRAGVRPKTNTWLKFRFDHAAAVDAVYGGVNQELLNKLNLFTVNTMVQDKEEYIIRPDLGRRLSDEAKNTILEKCDRSPVVQIIVADGLSSKAIEENLEDVYLSLQQSLKSLGLSVGTTFFIEKGRVAVMDDVGELLKPEVVVLLIGERPGLISAESLSAYLCYEPRKGTIEADRMVVSNIHKGGIPPVEAGAYLGTIIQKILTFEASGVSLVEKEQ
ncbi:ethanolamine ammonia-lyase subunit EutC [Bacillus sp. JJ722]|uniref:ethanolamine ammonia-lyase subunit EutC n=1 Tax=Bacillus sp. JJ722 TaxID=3122973 RepID=UPI002FFF8CAF